MRPALCALRIASCALRHAHCALRLGYLRLALSSLRFAQVLAQAFSYWQAWASLGKLGQELIGRDLIW